MMRFKLCTTAIVSAFLLAPLGVTAGEDGDKGKANTSQRVEGAMQGSQEALSGARQRTPEEANQGIDRALEQSRMGDEQSASAPRQDRRGSSRPDS